MVVNPTFNYGRRSQLPKVAMARPTLRKPTVQLHLTVAFPSQPFHGERSSFNLYFSDDWSRPSLFYMIIGLGVILFHKLTVEDLVHYFC